MNYAIGDSPIHKNLIQSYFASFRWVLPFVEVSETGVETDRADLEDCEMQMIVYEIGSTTIKTNLQISEGITVSGGTATVYMDSGLFEDYLRGCAYEYYLTFTEADGFKKTLFQGKMHIV